MSKIPKNNTHASNAGHLFHRRWTARHALRLILPKENLHAIAVEGLSESDNNIGENAEQIADLALYYGKGDNIETCESLEIVQFKHSTNAGKSVAASYLEKTITKFADSFNESGKNKTKLKFCFITNCKFSPNLTEAIKCLTKGLQTKSKAVAKQLENLKKHCGKNVSPESFFPLIDFNDSEGSIIYQERKLRRTLCNWSDDADGNSHALFTLVEEKSTHRNNNNVITREDVLNALGCDEEQIFPAEPKFPKIKNDIITRDVQFKIDKFLQTSDMPILLHATGGVGKTVFAENIAAEFNNNFEVVLFDCFAGGSYRREGQTRHEAKIGLVQIINEFAMKGFCDPILPDNYDTRKIIMLARKRFEQAAQFVTEQSSKKGILIIIDAADNAQTAASRFNTINEKPFPSILLELISSNPIPNVKLLLTARTKRQEDVICNNKVKQFLLPPFTRKESEKFLKNKRKNISEVEISRAITKSGGIPYKLNYFLESWEENIINNKKEEEISIECLIKGQIKNLEEKGWEEEKIKIFFTAIYLLATPIPQKELADALGWQPEEVSSAISDLMPMFAIEHSGIMFSDEPAESYVRKNYSSNKESQQQIAKQLEQNQSSSKYAAQSLPSFLVAINDSERAYKLAESEIYPVEFEHDYEKQKLKLARLKSAFALAARNKDFDRILEFSMKMVQVTSADSKVREYIRLSPQLAKEFGGEDIFRSLINDNSGWEGAEHCRLTLVYCFLKKMDEARSYYQDAVDWINCSIREGKDEISIVDFASVMFFGILDDKIDYVDKFLANQSNIMFFHQVVMQVIKLSHQYDFLTEENIFYKIIDYASSKKCRSLVLRLMVLSDSVTITNTANNKKIIRVANSLSKIKSTDKNKYDFYPGKTFESYYLVAALCVLIKGSKDGAKNILKYLNIERPISYAYTEIFGSWGSWNSIFNSCLKAWSKKIGVQYNHLLPGEDKDLEKIINNSKDAISFLKKQETKKNNFNKNTMKYSKHECEKICNNIEIILAIVRPLELAILRSGSIRLTDLRKFLSIWNSLIKGEYFKHEYHRYYGRSSNALIKNIGLRVAILLLQHARSIDKNSAEEIIKIISNEYNYSIDEKIEVLQVLACHSKLHDLVGKFGKQISEDISKKRDIEESAKNYQNLSNALFPLGINEAKSYYKNGIQQLNQVGMYDYQLHQSFFLYVSNQNKKFLSNEHSRRLMNLCKLAAGDEPKQFYWTLYSRAAANSIGIPAIYEFIRWADQDFIGYSYGLPQLVCFLAKNKKLCPKRATAILTLCDIYNSSSVDRHKIYDWKICQGLKHILDSSKESDHAMIINIIIEKIKLEIGNESPEIESSVWPSFWKGLISLMKEYKAGRDHIQHLENFERIQKERDDEKNRISQEHDSNALSTFNANDSVQKKYEVEAEFNKIVKNCNFNDLSSFDGSIRKVGSVHFRYFNKEKFIKEVSKSCKPKQRENFFNALCQTEELNFEETSKYMIDCLKKWEKSSNYLSDNRKKFIKDLFDFKGSKIFNCVYDDFSYQIGKISEFCNSKKFVIKQIIKVINRENVNLGSSKLIDLSLHISKITKPEIGYQALEEMLDSDFAKIADKFDEGKYKNNFTALPTETEMVVDIFWHLLGDKSTFTRWNSARSILSLAELGLEDELKGLVNKIGTPSNERLKPENRWHAYLNSEQWLLIGLARASYYQQSNMHYLAPILKKLYEDSNIHILSKIFIARCLSNIYKDKPEWQKWNDEKAKLMNPLNGYVAEIYGISHLDRYNLKAETDFKFDFYFPDEISRVAELFNLSGDEAYTKVIAEVKRIWPEAKDMDHFNGVRNYRQESNQQETFREHVQRHALLHVATNLFSTHKVAKSQHEEDDFCPWRYFLKHYDLTFDDGTWLADHKDDVPECANKFLLERNSDNKKILCGIKKLQKHIVQDVPSNSKMFPIYGSWQSRDDVHVYITSALANKKDANSICKTLLKSSFGELWGPTLDNYSGELRTGTIPTELTPWIWHPMSHESSIDKEDQFAAHTAGRRPKLGEEFSNKFGLLPDAKNKNWHNSRKNPVLQSIAWGNWVRNKYEPGYSQKDGIILQASKEWLKEILQSEQKSLVYHIKLRKYGSSRFRDEKNHGLDAVGLLTSDSNFQMWHAKLASQPSKLK